MQAKKIVILGGTGFVGQHLLSHLSDHQVTVLTRNSQQHRELRLHAHVTLRDANVYDSKTLQRHFKSADVVINLVGILNERGFGGKGFARAHDGLTQTVIAACQQANVQRLLQMSALNSGLGHSHYLQSRGRADGHVAHSGLQWTLLRPSVIFGAGDGLFCRFARMLKFIPVLPLARANARFAPVFVGDVAKAISYCISNPETVNKTYELGGPEVMTLKQIVKTTADYCDLKRWVIGLPNFLGRLQALAMDFVPGKPFSTDNYLSLALDSVPEQNGLQQMGITGQSVAAIMPNVLRQSARQAAMDRCRAQR